jgi:UDP-glucose 4-epimerase
MKILVTGGAGFIGSHVADILIEQGHTVHILDNLSTGLLRNVPHQADLFELDVRSSMAAKLVAEQEYECLLHHAAQMNVRRSVENPSFDADVNIGGLLNLMEAGVGNELEKVILASTGGAIYGEPEYTPQDLEHPLRPVSPYGVAKFASEKYLEYYQRQYGVQTVSLRYSNVYGPRQNSQGEAGVVAIFTRQMLVGEQPIIHGDGTQTRDYVFVGDVVEANLAALEHEKSGIYNVGTGRETSVNELFWLLRKATGVDTVEKHGPSKPGEQQRSVLSHEQTTDALGWVPQTGLEEGLDRTVDWFKEENIN